MGAQQSKTQEPIIFYNPNVPVEFSQGFVQNLEKKVDNKPEKIESRQVEELVRQRVNEELEKLKKNESQLKEKLYVDLADKNLEKGELNSVKLDSDMESMIDRIKRSSAKDLPEYIKSRQDAVITCYRNNPSRTLDCWKEVAEFKDAVAEEQKKFIATHQ
ncbi:hypothetical protein BDB01DRAFT_805609 [Pilobolus umbonatus]|nr:hypothetical protein BDB01DRAFT_805609 [Pilobolus umbonatus]